MIWPTKMIRPGTRGPSAFQGVARRAAMFGIVSIFSAPDLQAPAARGRVKCGVGDEAIDERIDDVPPEQPVEPSGRGRVPEAGDHADATRRAATISAGSVAQHRLIVRQKMCVGRIRRDTRSRSALTFTTSIAILPTTSGVRRRRFSGYQ